MQPTWQFIRDTVQIRPRVKWVRISFYYSSALVSARLRAVSNFRFLLLLLLLRYVVYFHARVSCKCILRMTKSRRDRKERDKMRFWIFFKYSINFSKLRFLLSFSRKEKSLMRWQVLINKIVSSYFRIRIVNRLIKVFAKSRSIFTNIAK